MNAMLKRFLPSGLPGLLMGLVLALFAGWGVALVVCWVLAWVQIANGVAELGRAAGHRAFLQSLTHK
jgi:hypothetical protein